MTARRRPRRRARRARARQQPHRLSRVDALTSIVEISGDALDDVPRGHVLILDDLERGDGAWRCRPVPLDAADMPAALRDAIDALHAIRVERGMEVDDVLMLLAIDRSGTTGALVARERPSCNAPGGSA